MKKELWDFAVSPCVVRANETSEITIRGKSGYYCFWDDVEYTVAVYPKEYHDKPIDEDFTLGGYPHETVTVRPVNGVLKFSCRFIGEQEWVLQVKASPKQKQHLNALRRQYPLDWLQDEMEQGKCFGVYSLEADLYNRRVLRGDLHVHSHYSDGGENPETIVANMRRHGYDFCAITDHHYYDSSLLAVERLKELKTGFTAVAGEEVHNKIRGRFHVVNFGGKASVNQKILADPLGCKAAVRAIADEFNTLPRREAEEVAWYKWLTDEIRAVGGMAIYAHPYWTAYYTYNCPTAITREVLTRGYFDAYEILGGCTPEENNLAVALYNDLRAEGVRIPIVGSTDCHRTHQKGESRCGEAQTLVFAKSAEEAAAAITDLWSVAVESISGEHRRVYGSFRLTKYALFLLDTYFPLHDRLCAASGEMMLDYFAGNGEAKAAVETAENSLHRWETAFFGK